MDIKYIEKNLNGIIYNTITQEKAILVENNNVPFFTFPVFNNIPFIKHGFSTRLGGVSKEYLYSMNLSFSRGDIYENVIENYKRMCNAIGINMKNLVLSDQKHNSNIKIVTHKDAGTGIYKSKFNDIDALVTNEKDLPLVTFFADCIPLFFVDIKNKVIGLAHSGWRGTYQKIGKKTIKVMRENYNSNPKDIIVVIAPSICQNCYEVSEDVAEKFREIFDKNKSENILLDKKNGKYQLDLWLANKYIINEAGVPYENIYISCVCTSCNSDLLYSHRKLGEKRGNLAGFLSL